MASWIVSGKEKERRKGSEQLDYEIIITDCRRRNSYNVDCLSDKNQISYTINLFVIKFIPCKNLFF